MKKMTNWIILIIGVMIIALIVWNGITIEIGNESDNGFHVKLEQYPLKRFFKY